jgi:oligopeptide transport system substrate-binding protein
MLLRNGKSSFATLLATVMILSALIQPGCQPTPQPAETKTFTYAVSADITSLDPVRATEDAPRLITAQVLETLVTYDDQLRLRPQLAESWEPLEGGKEWRFKLRPNVRFHDDPSFNGQHRTVNSGDVVYSLQRMLDPKSQTLGAFILTDVVDGAADFSEGKSGSVPGLIAEDALTVRIRLTKPYAQFPARLTLPFAAVVPKEAVAAHGDQWGTHPVGTGPFKLKSWDVANGQILLERNPTYWGQIQTNLTEVNFRILKSEAAQLTGFVQGGVDAFEISPAVADQVLEGGERLNSRFAGAGLLQTPTLKVHFVGFNLHNPILKDRNFRLACNYAINKDELTRQVLNGTAVPANGVLPPGLPGAADGPLYPQDVEKAKQLVQASPYRGQELVYTTDNSTSSVTVAEALQSQLASIGVKIRIDKNPESVWIDKLTKGSFDLAKLYFAFDYPSPDNGFSQFLTSNFAPTGPNFLFYTNANFDPLYEQTLQQSDPQQSAEEFRQLNQMIRDDAPWIFLYFPKRAIVIRGGVVGLKINPLSFSLLLTDVKKAG